MDSQIKGRVRVTAPGLTSDDYPGDVRLTPSRLVAVAQGQLTKSEIARMGNSWWTKNTTAAAALTAMPTTTSGLTLYNGSAASSQIHYVIDSVYAAEIVVDATQQNQTQLWVACGRSFTAPTAGAVATGSFTGIKTYGGSAIVAVAATTVVADSPWRPVGPTSPLAAAVAGGVFKGNEAKFDGEYIVPPGGAFHVAASKLAATASQIFYVISWHEVQMYLAA